MATLKITDFYIYKWRYQLGFAILSILSLGLLAFAGILVPDGLSEREMTSAATSINTPLSTLIGAHPEKLINAPYHLLQRGSVTLLGYSELAIKLPSLLLSVISLVCTYGVLRLWFRRNVAVVTSFLMLCSALFLTVAQLGTPDIMYIFYASSLLLTTSMIAYSTSRQWVWVLASATLGALSLYSPLGIYLILTLGITALVHPHARFILLQQSRLTKSLGILLFTLLLVPLFIGIIREPSILKTLFALHDIGGIGLTSAINTLAAYSLVYEPSGGEYLTPVYSLTLLALTTLGLGRLLSITYTAKSYIISIMLGMLVIIAFMPGSVPAMTLMPMIILIAFAIDYVIRSWYRLFPLNPYARVAGLVPLAVLVIGVAISDLERYTYSFHSLTASRLAYSNDAQLLGAIAKDRPAHSLTLLVPASQLTNYEAFASTLEGSPLRVTADKAVASSRIKQETIITTVQTKSDNSAPTSIIVSPVSEQAARFYLYKNRF